MALAVRSKRGKAAVKLHDRVCELYAKSGFSVFQTAQSQQAYVDAIAVQDNVLAEVIEIKVRYTGISLFELRNGTPFIIDVSKIAHGCHLSKALRVPFVVLCYLVDEDTIIKWKMTDHTGQEVIKYEAVTMATKKNINATETKQSYVAQLMLKDGEVITG